MRARPTAKRFVLLAGLVGVILVGTTFLGPTHVEWREVVSGPASSRVFWPLRVPRTLLAGCVASPPSPFSVSSGFSVSSFAASPSGRHCSRSESQ